MITLSENKQVLKIATPAAEAYSKLLQIPHASRPNLLAFPYKHDTIRYLRNIGLSLEGWHPMEKAYQFPRVQMIHDMYPHAKTTAQKAVAFERGFILNDPRTGKTSALIAMTNFLRYHEDAGACLVVAPLSTITEGNVWRTEIVGMTPGATVGYLFGKQFTGRKRIKEVRRLLRLKKDYYIINPAGICITELRALLKGAIDDGQITKMVIDESTEFGNPSTNAWKAARELSATLRWFWMATGTPGDPMTVYGQAKLMNPNNPAIPSNKDVWKLRTMYQITETKWVPKPDADTHIYKALTPAVRVKKRDVWPDMPAELVIPVRAELDPKTAQIIRHIRNDGSVRVAGYEMTPSNGGVSALRQLQISNGIFKITEGEDTGKDSDDSAEYLHLPITQKIETLLYLLRQTPGRTVIYSTFKEASVYLQGELTKHGFKPAIVNGTVSPEKRGPIFNAFNSDPDGPDVLIAHPKTVSYGVELAGMCDTLIFYGVPYISAFLYQQAVERLFSGSQKSTCPTIYWLYSLSQELAGFKGLKDGVDFSTNMADMFKEDV